MKRTFITNACILVVLPLFLLSGCLTVLTKSQVKEVNKFAAAAKGYNDMPGSVIAEHAKIRKARLILIASTYSDGDNAMKQIENALKQEESLIEKSRQADTTLKVLKDYAELLVNLTADDFTNSLQASSESLGISIDNGIKQYNELKGSNLGMVGSGVAAIVRGIGGIYIKVEQEKALKQAVISADPVIKSMTNTVEETMALYLDDEQLSNVKKQYPEYTKAEFPTASILSREKESISDKYKNAVRSFGGKQPPDLPKIVADEILACNVASSLAAKTMVAASVYRNAHSKLASAVQDKKELTDMIEDIQVLVDEVKAAQELKKKLDNN